MDHVYRAIRITNSLTKENGEEVSLKLGAHVGNYCRSQECRYYPRQIMRRLVIANLDARKLILLQ